MIAKPGGNPPHGAVAAAALLTAAGGAMDAWVYIAHGHVFANAQTGNVVLGAIALAGGHLWQALGHALSLFAFCLGIVLSRLGGAALKRRGSNSRSFRLIAEAACLVILALVAGRLGNGVVIACVGFLAAVQITALSHMDGWSLNTGMTTGNLRGALSAASAAWIDPSNNKARRQALSLGLMCLAFPIGAGASAAATLRWGDPALLCAAALILGAVAVCRDVPDPIP